MFDVHITDEGDMYLLDPLVSDVFPTAVFPSFYIPSIREYFQAERDQELRRWRDPKYPNMVVYPLGPNVVRALAEVSGYVQRVERNETTDPARNWTIPVKAAARYFDAHPAPEPERSWENAQVGEVWLLWVQGVKDPEPAVVTDEKFIFNDGYLRIKSHNNIIAGRRIWPEPEESNE